MNLNWPLIAVLFFLSLPGVIIAIPRLIRFLVPTAERAVIRKISSLAIFQTGFMVFIMIIGGNVLSQITQLKAPLLVNLISGEQGWRSIESIILPSLISSVLALLMFLLLFYGLLPRFIGPKNFQIIRNIHQTMGLDGNILYGAVTEEVIARWGIMNAVLFFAFIFVRTISVPMVWMAAVLSGILLAFSQLPAYIAAGCQRCRGFFYGFFLIHIWLSLIFSYVFWQYGLLAAIFSHMLFHSGWWIYDRKA